MKALLCVAILLSSCYTKTLESDYQFMNTIKEQAAIDSSLQTTIELMPKKYFFGERKNATLLKGSF